MYAVGVVCRFMKYPTSTHMKAAKRILRYLKGTLDFGLFYSSSNEFKLMGFYNIEYVAATSCTCQAISKDLRLPICNCFPLLRLGVVLPGNATSLRLEASVGELRRVEWSTRPGVEPQPLLTSILGKQY
ncbi:hypothetical protein CR513_52250, partial [Mucuna pruriens]